jgi:hypothetical protein
MGRPSTRWSAKRDQTMWEMYPAAQMDAVLVALAAKSGEAPFTPAAVMQHARLLGVRRSAAFIQQNNRAAGHKGREKAVATMAARGTGPKPKAAPAATDDHGGGGADGRKATPAAEQTTPPASPRIRPVPGKQDRPNAAPWKVPTGPAEAKHGNLVKGRLALARATKAGAPGYRINLRPSEEAEIARFIADGRVKVLPAAAVAETTATLPADDRDQVGAYERQSLVASKALAKARARRASVVCRRAARGLPV